MAGATFSGSGEISAPVRANSDRRIAADGKMGFMSLMRVRVEFIAVSAEIGIMQSGAVAKGKKDWNRFRKETKCEIRCEEMGTLCLTRRRPACFLWRHDSLLPFRKLVSKAVHLFPHLVALAFCNDIGQYRGRVTHRADLWS